MLPETAFHRQLAILPPDNAKTQITLIGCGGIGSVTALTLAKVGFENLTIYDDDIVEDHNLPSQLFTPAEVAIHKVSAIEQTIREFTNINVIPKDAKFNTETAEFSPIIISAVDSMAARKEIWDILKTRYDVALYIDARMSAEKMRIYAINPSDEAHQKFYEEQLYSDEEATQEECTAKAIAYNTFVIGGIVTSLVKKFVMGEPYPKEFIFDLQTYGLYRTPENPG